MKEILLIINDKRKLCKFKFVIQNNNKTTK